MVRLALPIIRKIDDDFFIVLHEKKSLSEISKSNDLNSNNIAFNLIIYNK
jgi:hypothetical protein